MTDLETSALEVFRQAVQHHNAGNMNAAEHGYTHVLEMAPNHAGCLHLMGVLKGQKGDFENAIRLVRQSLSISPENQKAYSNLGLILQKAGKHQDALAAYNNAIALDSHNINGWLGSSACHAEMDQLDQALLQIEKGIQANESCDALYDNACIFLKRLNKFQACLEMAERGIEKEPNSAKLHIHKAHASFALGHLAQAWEEYIWRHKSEDNVNTAPTYPLPHWQGEDLTQKSILIWTEQGPGETFMLSDVLSEIVTAAKKCIVVTPLRLSAILERSFPDAEIWPAENSSVSPSSADVQSSLVDACRWLRPAWSAFPPPTPRIIANSELYQGYKNMRTIGAEDVVTVGLSWRSFGVVNADQKSVLLSDLTPILNVAGVKFVNLQYGDVSEEIDNIMHKQGTNIALEASSDPVSNLDDHLAHIASLDLVISTSNTTAHAAACLGVTTWVLLSHTLGEGLYWPWFVNRTDSPWYQDATLYRQKVRGDWQGPIQQIGRELSKFVAQRI